MKFEQCNCAYRYVCAVMNPEYRSRSTDTTFRSTQSTSCLLCLQHLTLVTLHGTVQNRYLPRRFYHSSVAQRMPRRGDDGYFELSASALRTIIIFGATGFLFVAGLFLEWVLGASELKTLRRYNTGNSPVHGKQCGSVTPTTLLRSTARNNTRPLAHYNDRLTVPLGGVGPRCCCSWLATAWSSTWIFSFRAQLRPLGSD